MKRFLLSIAVATALAGAVVPSAQALRFADGPCFEDSAKRNVCPPGAEGVAYSIQFRSPTPAELIGGEGCWPHHAFNIDSGMPPPGLSLSSDGWLTGTPTQAGTYHFFVKMRDVVNAENQSWCSHPLETEEEFWITVSGGAALEPLSIGPDFAGPGTVGVPYSLAMTATLSNPKTWSIAAGALPPGLALGADGVISGTPAAAGAFTFTIQATVDAQRSDSQPLGIVIRSPLSVVVPAHFTGTATPVAVTEVGMTLADTFTATGGTGAYAWSLTSGGLPTGVSFANGIFSGSPSVAGSFPFTVTVGDTEGRTASFSGLIEVAQRLLFVPHPLRQARVGRLYRVKLKATGGILPSAWKVKGGRLPRGVRLDAVTGILAGTPKRAGKYRVTIVVTDALGVKSARALTLVVRA